MPTLYHRCRPLAALRTAAIIRQTMVTEEHIRQALRDCYDPEIPLNIVELGMVSSIVVKLDPDAPGAGIAGVPDRYAVQVTLLSPGEDEEHQAQRSALIANRLAGLPELSKVTIQTEYATPWTPARITEAGRRQLRLDQPQFPILNNRVR